MNIKSVDFRALSDSNLSKYLTSEIRKNVQKKVRIMEVCGTHTVSIFRAGIRSLLPSKIKLCSGPGCPVCVTTQGEIDAFIKLSNRKDIIITTFGDLIRVPGSCSSLQEEKAKGADVRIVYSSFDALNIAKENKNKKVIFLGVGFETTAPTIASAVLFAKQIKLKNFYVMSAHKIVPPALKVLLEDARVNIDGFLLPGHVSVIIGIEGYRSLLSKLVIPCVVSGFEPIDILRAISMLLKQIRYGGELIQNAYERVVKYHGNIKAMNLLRKVFDIVDTEWRGLGIIEKSGLTFKEKYSNFDAQKKFGVEYEEVHESKNCSCGDVLMGIKDPFQCSLYKKYCTPMNPVGPCMVSSEGTCAAYYRYG